MANMKLPNQPNEAELTDFLSIVDKLDDVIKGMNSEDDGQKQKYMAKADDLLKEVESKKKSKEKDSVDEEDADLPKTSTGFSRTSINKDAYKNDAQPPPEPYARPEEPVDQQAFMAAMEADARERAERRREREKIAAGFKEQGNEEFKKGNFSGALEFYNKAIEQIKDSTALYTNRAQTRINLGLFEEAISDCDWAMRVWPKCLKAYVHKGHAYLGLKEFDKARENYDEILKIDPSKEEMVKGYINKVNRSEKALEEERKASKLMDDGDHGAKTVTEVLKSLKREKQPPIFYAGGLRLLMTLLVDLDSQTIFRSNDGFTLLSDHPVISRYFSSSAETLSKAEKELMSSVCDMLIAACSNNDANQEQLFKIPKLTVNLLTLLETSSKNEGHRAKASCVNLLHEISNSETGRTAIINNFEIKRLIVVLMRLTSESYKFADIAAAVLNNLALHKKLKVLLRDKIEEEILPAFEHVLKQEKVSASRITLVSSMATNLTMDKSIRCKMASSPSLWNTMHERLKACSESVSSLPVESLLGLFANVTTDTKSSTLSECGVEVVTTCYNILKSDVQSKLAVERAFKVISNILPLCHAAVSFMGESSRHLIFLSVLQDENSELVNKKSCLRCLATLTQQESVCMTVADNKGTSTLLQLLNHKDENVIGNAALCLSHMCSIKKVCAKLTKTSIIQKLLVLARDGRNKNLQSNSAILIGKLAKGDERHLQQLRELHGVEILHQCMKHID